VLWISPAEIVDDLEAKKKRWNGSCVSTETRLGFQRRDIEKDLGSSCTNTRNQRQSHQVNSTASNFKLLKNI